ncbi:hypothetical protein [Zavarzinella formosa]|uniref:hypothetical protein n=1 Tax=Zavarzinella formosa TaxID=360055 RepID=UPI00035CC846|nr:hypothetical protein [Zavarzinella formosa]
MANDASSDGGTYYAPNSTVEVIATGNRYRTAREEPRNRVYSLIDQKGNRLMREFTHDELKLIMDGRDRFFFGSL